MTAQKTTSGFIPLIVLLVAGIVIAGAGGAYIVRNEFIKTDPVKKASLDTEKVEEQIKNPTPLPTPTPGPKKEIVSGPFTYTPEKTPKTSVTPTSGEEATTEPGFTINPPSGWEVSSSGDQYTKALFQNPEKDYEEAEDPLQIYIYANVQVLMDQINSWATLDQAAQVEIDGQSQKGKEIVSNRKIQTNGESAYLIEYRYRHETGVWVRVREYLFVKNSHAVLVLGLALEEAWGERSGQIQSSLNSFVFTD